jgi:predicted N-acetyltransferase YhbS
MRIEYLSDDMRAIRLVAGWLHAEFGDRGRGSTLETRVQRIRKRAQRQTIPLAFVARENGSIVGSASLVAHDMEARLDLTPWLASVYVLPGYRKRGIGSALCRRVAQETRGLGFGRIYLITYDKEEFYRGLGWKEIQRTEYRRDKVTVMASV